MLDGSPSDSTDLDEALWLRNTYEKVTMPCLEQSRIVWNSLESSGTVCDRLESSRLREDGCGVEYRRAEAVAANSSTRPLSSAISSRWSVWNRL